MSGLFGAEQVARPAQFEVLEGHLHPGTEIVVHRDGLEPVGRGLRQRLAVVVEEVRVGPLATASDASAQLVELTQTVLVGAIDDDRVRVGDVQARLDDRRRDQHIRSTLPEVVDHLLQLVLAHLPVRHRDPRLGHELGEVGRDALNGLHPIVHVEDLSLAQQLTPDRRGDLLVVAGTDERQDRMTILRRRRERRHLADAGDRHLQRARDRGRAHREDVDVGLQLLQRILVLDAEALLLVDDHQPEVLEDDLLGEDAVGADHHVDRPVGEAGDDLSRLLVGLEARQRTHLDGEAGEALGEGLEMLLDQERGGNEHRDLLAVLDRLERRAHGDLGLAEPDVAGEESIHRDGLLHVGLDLVDRLQLVGRLGEREGFFELALPRRVLPEGVSLRGHARGIELHELHRDVAHRLAGAPLRLRPVAPAHLRQRGCLSPDVPRQEVELIGGHEQLVAGVAALGGRVLEHQVLPLALHGVAAARGHLPLHQLDELADAVRGVHDEVAGLELERVDDVPAPRGELLHHARVAADGAAVELRLGEHRELRTVGLETPFEHGAGELRGARGHVAIDAVHDPRGDPPLAQHVARPLDQSGTGCGHHDAPAVREQTPHVLGRAVDVALEARHRCRGDLDGGGGFEGGIHVDEPFRRRVGRARVEPAEGPPHAAALGDPLA